MVETETSRKKKIETTTQNLKIFLSPSRGVEQPKNLEGPE